MVIRIDGKLYFKKNSFYRNPGNNLLECPTTLDRWKRFGFKPKSYRVVKRAYSLFNFLEKASPEQVFNFIHNRALYVR